MLNAKDWTKAAVVFQSVIERDPASTEGYAGCARVAMANKNWPEAERYWNKCFELQPDNYPDFWILKKANVSFALGAVDDAETLFAEYCGKKPQKPWGYAGLAQVAMANGNWPEALHLLNKCFEVTPGDYPGKWALKKIDVLLAMNKLEEAEELVNEYLQNRPGGVWGYVGLARIAAQRHLPKMELQLWKKISEDFPNFLNGHLQYARILRYFENSELAENLLQGLRLQHPGSEAILEHLAWTASSAKDYSRAVKRFRELAEQFPGNSKYKRLYVRSLMENIQFEEAQDYFDRHLSGSDSREDLILQVRLYWDMIKVDKAFDLLDDLLEKFPGDANVIGLYVQYLRSMYRPAADKKLLFQALDLIDSLKEGTLKKDRTLLLQMDIYLMLDEPQKVMALFEELRDKRSELALKWQAWKLNYEGDFEGSKKVWEQIQETFYIPQIQRPAGEVLQRADSNPMEWEEEAILLFTAVRNERWRLPWFLDYYRKLGVDRFFFVDNDSTDDTSAFLLKQKDVHVFYTNQSYAKSCSGMQWMNGLIEEYGSKAWCMYVDVDEALVFPDSGNKNLKDLTRYMAHYDYEAMHAFMLDMEADGGHRPPKGESEYLDFEKDYPLFDNQYNRVKSKYCPYYYTAGGFRRKFNINENQTKTPIIKGGRGIKFIQSSHQITPATLSDLSSVLLHYKMAGNAKQIFSQDLEENNRMPRCRRRYWAYLQETPGSTTDTKNENTVPYKSSQQLVDLGLITTSAEFKAFGK